MLKYLVAVLLEITESCNLHCLYYYNNSRENKHDIPRNKLLEIIDDIDTNNHIIISISGGEPSLYESNKICKGICKTFSFNNYNNYTIKDTSCFKQLI